MNRARRLIRMNAAGRKPLALAAALAGAAMGLSGCISDPFNHATDSKVPGAAQISQLGATQGPYPRWSKFPAAPTNVPTTAMFAQTAHGLDADQTQLLHEMSELHWTLYGTEEWAAQQRAMLDPAMAAPAPPNAQESMEAWAALQRALATPPPRVK